jgi:hypothetical protein
MSNAHSLPISGQMALFRRVLRRATPVAQERFYRAPEKSPTLGPAINNSPQQRLQSPVTTWLA